MTVSGRHWREPGVSRTAASMTAASTNPAAGPHAFETLFRAEFPTMLRLATLLGAADPENIAQEAFVRLHHRWDALAEPSRAGGYLRTTVVNLCRSAARHQGVVDRADATRPEPLPAPSAESLALERISDAHLIASLGALSPRHREALVLRFWLDLPEQAMAEAMGCSPGSVKSHVSRGLKALRAALTDGDDAR